MKESSESSPPRNLFSMQVALAFDFTHQETKLCQAFFFPGFAPLIEIPLSSSSHPSPCLLLPSIPPSSHLHTETVMASIRTNTIVQPPVRKQSHVRNAFTRYEPFAYVWQSRSLAKSARSALYIPTKCICRCTTEADLVRTLPQGHISPRLGIARKSLWMVPQQDPCRLGRPAWWDRPTMSSHARNSPITIFFQHVLIHFT